MAIANSGSIGISTIKSFWGAGANGIGSYYRGGGIVPSQRPGGLTPGNQKPGNTVPGNPSGCSAQGYSPGNASASIIFNNSTSNGDPNKGKYVANISFSNGWCGGGPNGAADPTKSYTNKGSYACCDGKWSKGSISGTSPKTVSAQPSNGVNPPGTNPPTTNPPTTNPPTQTNPTPINTGIPSSGTIRLSNFYGGVK